MNAKLQQCQNCKHANEYIPLWAYPHADPRCSVHHRRISPDDSCDDFELIGRLSR
jgi:hypothetical protein